MPTNLQIFNKGDLDVIFNPRVSAKRDNVGIVASNGEDISNLFEPTNGSDQINFDTGYLTGRTDIRYLFQRKGYFPQYFLSVSDVVVNEGGTITCIIDVTDVPEGTQVCYYTSSDSDFVVPTGTATIQNATATFSLTLKADQLTEGLETVNIYLKDCVKNTVLATSDLITIRDTSRTPPTYSISTTSTEVNEGGSVTYSIVTTDVDDQTILFYTTSSNTDFDNPTGSVSVFSGKASLTLNVKNDLTTEGSETFRVFLKTDGLTGTTVATSSDVTIKDTSRTPPTYIITPDKTSAREGEKVTFTVRTTDVDNGVVLYYAASLPDDVTPSTGAITIQSGTAVFTLTVKEDMLVEAGESFTVALKTDSINGTTVRTSTSVAITTDCFKGSTKLSEITTTPTSLTPVSFGNFGAGRYVIEYVSGAYSQWSSGDRWLVGQFTLKAGTSTSTIGDHDNYTENVVESKGREWNSKFNVFTHPGGDISLTILDSPVIDNRIHPSYGAPKYAIYDYTCGNSPLYTIRADKTVVSEGDAIIVTVDTTGLQNGTILYYSTSLDADFDNPTGQVTINNNTAQFTLNVKKDLIYETTETFVINLRRGSIQGVVAATSSSITITPSQPTYSIASNRASVVEGSSIIFTVTTTDVQNGTILYYSTSSDADFDNPTGQVTINNNTGQFTLNAKKDLVFEGTELFTVTLKTGSQTGTVVCTTGSITLIDAQPTYTITANKASVVEGTSIVFTVTTTDVQNGTILYYSTSSDADFDAPTGQVTINNNTAQFILNAKKDLVFEGSELVTVNLKTGSQTGTVVCTSGSVTIIDANPTYTITANKSSVVEGGSVIFTVTTTDVQNGTILYYSTSSDADFIAPTGQITINSDTAQFTLNVKADLNFEGSELFTVNLKTGSQSGTIVRTSESISITDATATYKIDPTPITTASVSEGGSITFTVTTTDVQNGTIAYYYTSSDSDFINPTGQVTINNNTAQFTLNVKNDLATEGNEQFIASLKSATNVILCNSTNITIRDTSTTPPTYKIEPNKVVISEGDTIKFTVSTTEIPNGTKLYLKTTSDSDFNSYSNEVTVNNNTAELNLTVKNDIVTEGDEYFTVSVSLVSVTGTVVCTSASVQIRDTSRTPIYAITANKASVDEGDVVTFAITTQNVVDGTVLYYEVDFNLNVGTNAGDFTGTTTGSVTTLGGKASFDITAKADLITEGIETFLARIRTNSNIGSVVATSPVVTINDTSKTPPTYSITSNTFSVNEGETIAFSITTTNVGNGTVLYYDIVNTTTNAGDFTGVTSGSVSILNNSASFSINIKADLTTEGSETFKARLLTGSSAGSVVATSASISISDTSKTPPTYSITPNVYTINEGDTVSFNITTTNVDNNTLLYYDVINTSTVSGDFTGNISGSVTIVNNKGLFSIVAKNDFTTEFTETFKLNLRAGSSAGSIVSTSASISINDTSTTPPTYSLSCSHTSANEGTTVTFTIITTNVTNGTTIPYTITGISSADISSASLTGNFTIRGNTASVNFTISNDITTEGSETMTMTAASKTASVVINDTSTLPIPTYSIQPNVSEISEGGSVTFNIATSNVANGTQLSYSLTRTDITPNTGTVTINSNRASFAVTANNDRTTEGYTTFTASLKSGSTTLATSNSVGINDTSTTPITYPDTLTFDISQFAGDCWRLYVSGSNSKTYRVICNNSSNAFGSKKDRRFTFNPTSNPSERVSINDQGWNGNRFNIETISLLDGGGSTIKKWDIQKSFYTGSDINGSTTARFTITNLTGTTVPNSVYTLSSNTISSGTAKAVFTIGIN